MIPTGGRLSHFRAAWAHSEWATRLVSKGLGWRWRHPPPFPALFQQRSTPVLRNFLAEMLAMGVVEPAKFLRFQGRLFSVPKRNGGQRVILDLSRLNRSILCPKFRMFSVPSLRKILPPDAFTVSVDVQDAFWHVPVAPPFRQYLGFILDGKKWRFCAAPFGLSVIPRAFSKLMSSATTALRLKGIQIASYLDDLIIWNSDPHKCVNDLRKALSFLQALGFIINFKKSRLIPQQYFEWLGIIWDSHLQVLSLPLRHQTKAIRAVRNLISRKTVSLKILQRTLGTLNFVSITDPILKCKLKDWHRFRHVFKRNPLLPRLLPRSLKVSMARWLHSNCLAATVPLKPPESSMDIFTDSSLTGWGLHTSLGQEEMGNWPNHMRNLHINILEFATVLIALKIVDIPSNGHVTIHSDSSTVVEIIRRGGSAKSSPLNKWMLSVLKRLKQTNCHLSATHISGARNVIADTLSRNSPAPTEWTLDQLSFQWATSLGPHPQVDLFATRKNRQLPQFVSPMPDSEAVACDSLHLDWNQWTSIYLFPPTSLLGKVLPKLESFKGFALLIAPMWPNAPWYPRLSQLCSPARLPNPVLTQKICGKHFSGESFLTKSLHVWTFWGPSTRERSRVK